MERIEYSELKKYFDNSEKIHIENFYNLLMKNYEILSVIQKDVQMVDVASNYKSIKQKIYDDIVKINKNVERYLKIYKVQIEHFGLKNYHNRGDFIIKTGEFLLTISNSHKNIDEHIENLKNEIANVEKKKMFLEKEKNNWVGYFDGVDKSLKMLRKNIGREQEILKFVKDDINLSFDVIGLAKKEIEFYFRDDEVEIYFAEVNKKRNLSKKEKEYLMNKNVYAINNERNEWKLKNVVINKKKNEIHKQIER